MRKAYHPRRNNKITVPVYVMEFGNDAVTLDERARCPVCNQRLTIVAPSSTGSIGHFSHIKGAGYCPTKSKAAAPYAGLPPRNPDFEAAKRIRKAFLANWQKHYLLLDWIVKGLAIDEFTEVINTANRERIWEYAKLEEFQLPYVFATLMDFLPSRSYKLKDGSFARKCWFRCWFDASVQRYDDLWIHRESPLMFWRAWYELPNGKRKPGMEDLLDSYSLGLSADFLTRNPTVIPFVESKISQWLTRHFRVD
jgi:hypothetical protein